MFKGSYEMLNVRQLSKSSDSVRKEISKIKNDRMKREVTTYFLFGKYFEKGWTPKKYTLPKKVKTYGDLIPDSALNITYSKGADKMNLLKNSLEVIHSEYKQVNFQDKLFNINWHKKFALSFACMVLFLIGAPLGSIIRKGGLGMPLVIAVVFFLIFHLLNMFGEKFAKQELLTPFWGIWMPSIVLLPIGIFLITKAMNDSQLFNNEAYSRFFRKFSRKRKTPSIQQ
jgi:lipopolysaccharide export system permease protein